MSQACDIYKIDKANHKDYQLFLDFPFDIYDDKKLMIYTRERVISMINEAGDFDLFLAKSKNGNVLGRMVMGINHGIIDETGVPYAYIGLFDVVEDYDVFKQMIDYGKDYFSNNAYILFPFFKSTWYPYRFTSEGFDCFNYFMEYPDKKYYAEYTNKYGFESEYKYLGSITYDMDGLISDNKYSYQKAMKHNIQFRNFDKSRSTEDLKIIYELTTRNYNNKTNLFYTAITFDEFNNLYRGIINMLDSEFLTIGLNEKGDPISYCFSPPDYTPLILGTSDTITGFIPKTVATDKAYRKMGVVGGMLYLQSIEAKKRNYTYAIGGFTDERLFTHELMPDDLEWKKYSLYKLKI